MFIFIYIYIIRYTILKAKEKESQQEVLSNSFNNVKKADWQYIAKV